MLVLMFSNDGRVHLCTSAEHEGQGRGFRSEFVRLGGEHIADEEYGGVRISDEGYGRVREAKDMAGPPGPRHHQHRR